MKRLNIAHSSTRGSQEAELTACPPVAPPSALDTLVLQRCTAALNVARNAPEPLHVRARDSARLVGRRAAAALKEAADTLASAAAPTDPTTPAKTES